MPQTALTAGNTFVSKQCPKQCPPNTGLLCGETGPSVCYEAYLQALCLPRCPLHC